MQKPRVFKYFPEYDKWAKFSDEECHCQGELPCLDPIFFENPNLNDPVCLDLLADGRVQVEIPDWLQKQLLASIVKTHPNWEDYQVKHFATLLVDELSRTPPVPWIQHNAWPVCCGDFCCYLGEWNQDRFIEVSPDGNGSAFLWAILEDSHRNRRDDPYQLWQEIKSEWTTIYVFKCFTCDKFIAVDQSY